MTSDFNAESFGLNLRNELNLKNWSDEDLVHHLGLLAPEANRTKWHTDFRRFRVQSICSGKCTSTSAEEVQSLAAALGCTVENLLFDTLANLRLLQNEKILDKNQLSLGTEPGITDMPPWKHRFETGGENA